MSRPYLLHRSRVARVLVGCEARRFALRQKMSRTRLDIMVLDRGLAESREKARRLILAGRVLVDGALADKPGRLAAPDSSIELVAAEKYVSRGGEKLERALDVFRLDVRGLVCLDVGASTGGFTDCMLQRGASRVYAVDAGRGQLHWKLRNDPRVVVMEKTNARYLRPENFPDRPAFAAIDVAFISLTKVLPSVKDIVGDGASIVSLIKPQFEAARSDVSRGGVVRDAAVRERVVEKIRAFGTRELDLKWVGVCESPIEGPAGNLEFLAHWKKP